MPTARSDCSGATGQNATSFVSRPSSTLACVLVMWGAIGELPRWAQTENAEGGEAARVLHDVEDAHRCGSRGGSGRAAEWKEVGLGLGRGEGAEWSFHAAVVQRDVRCRTHIPQGRPWGAPGIP